MLIKKPEEVRSSEITSQSTYLNRRAFLGGAAALAGAAVIAKVAGAKTPSPDTAPNGQKLSGVIKGQFSTDEKQTPYKDITNYNNFYEFSTDKYQPANLAKNFRTRPWTVKVEGLVQKPKTYDIDSLLKLATLEDRVYRHRCVEGWSMVIPWVGYSFKKLMDQVQPLGNAKYVEFTTLNDPAQMPGVRYGVLDWPYTEGLRLDEASHPLALLTVGLYGEVLPNQDGAPVRIVVPWKYGFKSCKSIVKIRFTDKEPRTAWNKAAPNEYGFYSNVNPNVDHPRWSQARERRIGEFTKRPTLMFNGYGDQVASLYTGMDLKKFF
ncbi:MAG TPA: protein-methionine-sulfoxide reductase catalytic subunit MsrP [Terriglobales bacterium]|nr:protein-methionine-sulfoxide reductase catalytic subunit MsrP [Terriglobales bacterium]